MASPCPHPQSRFLTNIVKCGNLGRVDVHVEERQLVTRALRRERRGALAMLALMACVLGAFPAVCGAEYVVELTDDGAWCWYSSPGALYHDHAVYTGWVNRWGDIIAAEYVLGDSVTSTLIIHPRLEPDDHDHPVFYATSDGRLTAFYSQHARVGTPALYRTTMSAWGIGSWFGEHSTGVNTSGAGGVTYANPVAVPGRADTIFLFWRG